jgi:hypothetical protein
MSKNSDEEKPYLYKCPYCKQLFYTREETIKHMKVSHKKAMNAEYGPTQTTESVGAPGFSFPGMGGRW